MERKGTRWWRSRQCRWIDDRWTTGDGAYGLTLPGLGNDCRATRRRCCRLRHARQSDSFVGAARSDCSRRPGSRLRHSGPKRRSRHGARGADGKESEFAETNRTLKQQLDRGFLSDKPKGNLLSLDELKGKKVLDLAAGTQGKTVRDLRDRASTRMAWTSPSRTKPRTRTTCVAPISARQFLSIRSSMSPSSSTAAFPMAGRPDREGLRERGIATEARRDAIPRAAR